MTRDATLAPCCPAPLGLAAPRGPQFPGSCHQTPARPSSQSLYDLPQGTGCLPGASPKPGGLGTLLPWSRPFSLWASLLSPSAPLWLQARGSLLMATGTGRPSLAGPWRARGALAADPGGPAPTGSEGPHSHVCPWHS